uniref:OTU domain-containing protein n=1 Tax=Trypanosoma congolense (strain IL3000) TaxID=1068625 RepID=G0US95_TRYCI|nr:conserved hypothetical protein [Trypanosoma congolense IL3000]
MGACVSDGGARKPSFVNRPGTSFDTLRGNTNNDGMNEYGSAMGGSQDNRRHASVSGGVDKASPRAVETSLPRIRVFTKADDAFNDSSDDSSDDSSGASAMSVYKMTPIVAMKPFASIKSRARAVKVIRKSYYPNEPHSSDDEVVDASSTLGNKEEKSKRDGGKKSKASKDRVADDSSSNSEGGLSSGHESTTSPQNGAKVGEADSSGGVAMRPKPVRLSREEMILLGKKRLKKRLEDLKLTEHEMKDDGNCQFRAIAHQIFGSQEYHQLVRVHVVTYMKSVRDMYDCFLGTTEEADKYYAEMYKNGTWGDELTLRAACDSLFVNIHILSSEEENYYITYSPSSDAPLPHPAFLVDVATMQEDRQRSLDEDTHSHEPLTFARFGGDSGTGRNTKLPPIHEEVDVCKRQREVQCKLAESTIVPAPVPVPLSLLPFKELIEKNREALPPQLAQPKPVVAEKPRKEPLREETVVVNVPPGFTFAAKNTNVIIVRPLKKPRRKRRRAGRSKRTYGLAGLSRRSAERRKVLFSVPTPVTRKGNAKRPKSRSSNPSHKKGRSKSRRSGGGASKQHPFSPMSSFASQGYSCPVDPTSPLRNKRAQSPSGRINFPTVSEPIAAPAPPTTTSFILVSPRSLGSDMVKRLSLSNTSGQNSSLWPGASDSEANSMLKLSSSLSAVGEEPCLISEAPKNPIDILLSYLSPVHYNALSMDLTS